MLAVERLAQKVKNRPRRSGDARGSGVRTPIRGTSEWFLMVVTVATAVASLVVALGLIGVGISRSFDGGVEPQAAVIPAATARPTVLPPPPTATPRPATPIADVADVTVASALPVVCLDPGHGGDDWGAVRPEDDVLPEMRESAFTLSHALDLASRLSARGLTPVLTRDEDTWVNADNADVNGDGNIGKNFSSKLDDFQARINICNDAGADLLLVMHINTSDNPDDEGYEVIYTVDRPFGDENLRFAELLHDELGEQMAAAGYDAGSRGIIDDITLPGGEGDLPHMVMTGPDVAGKYVASTMPGALTEPLVMANDADAVFLASTEGQNAIVTAYERAILRFFDLPTA